MLNLPQPPSKTDPRFDDWLFRFYKLQNSFSAGGGASDHTQLSNLNSTTYTHLQASQAEALTGGGNTALHYHASDRARANHTGTQSAATISDLSTFIQNVQAGSSILESQIFGG